MPSILLGTDTCCSDDTVSSASSCEYFVDNIAALRAVVIEDATSLSVVVGGSVDKGDGLGDVYVYDGASTANDDGITVIDPTGNVGPGRWVLVNSARASPLIRPFITAKTPAEAANVIGVVPALSPIQFGAVGDGVTDDYPAIQAMMVAAAALQATGNNVLVDGGNYTFATSGPLVVTSNTAVRNFRAKALTSNTWIARQSPARVTTNGIITVPERAVNVNLENCFLDCRGIQGGDTQTDLVTSCNGITVQNGASNVHLTNCTVRNPSTGQSGLYVLGSVVVTACQFTCIDTANAATYSSYGIRLDFLAVGTVVGANNCRFIGCEVLNGLFQIFVSPGCNQIYFVAGTHFTTVGNGPNANIGVQINGFGIVFDGCFHDSTIRYSTGGTWTTPAGPQTQVDVDFRMLNCGGTVIVGSPALVLQAQAPNSTLNGFKYGYGHEPLINQQILIGQAAGGSWNYGDNYIAELINQGDNLFISPHDLVIAANVGPTVQTNYSDDAHEALATFTALGGTIVAPGAFVGARDNDAVLRSGDGTSEILVPSQLSTVGDYISQSRSTLASGPLLGHQVVYPNFDPNDTTSLFFSGKATTTNRFIVFSNGNVVNSNNSYGAVCDERTKKDIVTAPAVSDRLAGLRVTNFTSILDPDGAPVRTDFIAQEVEPIFPEIVGQNDSTPVEEQMPGGPTLFVLHSRLIPYLVQGWQEERAARLALEARVAALETPAASPPAGS